MFTLSDCITRINQILNYPAFTYTDISHFFDQAISELNSTFRIGMPLVSQMISEQAIRVQDKPNLVVLASEPTGTASDIPAGTIESFTDTSKTYYNTSDNKLYKYSILTEQWDAYDKMYGLYAPIGSPRAVYETLSVPLANQAIWVKLDEKRLNDIDLTVYMPEDWVILFLIPYVCFKATMRDGGNGALYSEEFVQGFQQLQTSYDVPNKVLLSRVAHLPAYTAIVKSHLSNLAIEVPTRAVYPDMKIGNSIMPSYGGFNSRGGWGI